MEIFYLDCYMVVPEPFCATFYFLIHKSYPFLYIDVFTELSKIDCFSHGYKPVVEKNNVIVVN